MRALGVDFGDSRTGVAMSDPMGWTAQGLLVVKGGMGRAAARIAEIVRQHGVRTIVVGYPINMDGTPGHRAERTDSFINALYNEMGKGPIDIDIVKWDERLTSVEAARILKTTGARPTSRGMREKGSLDMMAAAIILQSYLDSKINDNGSQQEGEPYERRQ
ncbi:MAG: Holliday junction resolvase RuvX [Oscillospiraceae bacterium]|nr:Holliday junction resolvase RuvX [Oscillospiraceae bacterium]